MFQISLLTPHIIFVIIGILYLIKLSISIAFFISSHFITEIPTSVSKSSIIETVYQKIDQTTNKENFNTSSSFFYNKYYKSPTSTNQYKKYSIYHNFIYIKIHSNEVIPSYYILSNYFLRPPPSV